MTDKELAYAKLEELKKYLMELQSIAVAFSGGVDSAFLLKVAHDVLKENAVAITVDADFFPKREYDESIEFCNKEGIRQYFCLIDVLETEAFKTNPPNRCYFCKKNLFSEIRTLAFEKGISYIAEGSNMDDDKDYRPGMKAVKELGILSPLKKVGLLKKEIRFLSKELGLPTWNKPSYACLASRFVYGDEITKEKLLMVEKSEQLLYELGFRQFRVRVHGSMARIEILPQEFDKLMEETVRQKITDAFKEYGFTYVSLDLAGYRTGSMNETISVHK